MNAFIRRARRSDCPAMRDIYNHYVLHDTCTFAIEPESLAERDTWFDAHGEDHPIFVAEEDGRVVAWASVSPYNSRCAYRTTVEDSIYLDKDARGRGLGRTLLDVVLAAARDRGHHTMIAAIGSESAASVALHAKAGFTQVGRFAQVGHKQGRWLDVIYMQRMLRGA